MIVDQHRTPEPNYLLWQGSPHDEAGKQIIFQRVIEWCRQPSVRYRVAFIEDYEMNTARKLVQGMDVWLRRPLENANLYVPGGPTSLVNGFAKVP